MYDSIRTIAILATCLGLAGQTTSATAAQPRGQTWGKPGVSFLQYRTDAVECAHDAETKALGSDPQIGLALVAEGRQMDSSAPPEPNPRELNLNPGLNPDISAALDYAALSEMRMERKLREVALRIEPILTACLTERGYKPLKLTSEQASELQRLRAGTRARNVYLWSLAADPAVLQSQAR